MSRYSVCLRCNAKMFSPARIVDCPRCGIAMAPGIVMVAPWCSRRLDPGATESDANDRLLRTMSYALRHNPRQYFLEMDRSGWVDIDHFTLALRYEHPGYAQVTADDLRTIAEHSDLARFEVVGNRIRALYGHSFTELDRADPETPPQYLFHGTLGESVPGILKDGLLPMGRSCVHLTLDWRYAHSVAQAKSPRPIVLVIGAAQASLEGVRFWRAGDHVWLADATPPRFIRRLQEPPVCRGPGLGPPEIAPSPR